MDSVFNWTMIGLGLIVLFLVSMRLLKAGVQLDTLQKQLSESEMQCNRLEVRPRLVSVLLYGVFTGYVTTVVMRHDGKLVAPDDPERRVLKRMSVQDFSSGILGAPSWKPVVTGQEEAFALPGYNHLVPVLTMLGQVYYMERELYEAYQRPQGKNAA